VLVKVLFVAGYGRSGSTLLDRTLGQVDGFCSVGELRHVFREGYLENRLCGCGEEFRSCPFWREVTREAFGSLARFDALELVGAKSRVDRWWRLPQLAWGLATPARRSDLARYRDALRRLYTAIATVSGAEVIVDSSKDVSHGYVLRGIGTPVEPFVLHLVRDSRAVAYSWQRRKFNPGSGADMQRYGLVRTSAEWTAINALTALHRRFDRRYAVLRYRDLAADPRAAVRGVLDLLGEAGRELPVRGADTVVLGDDHTAAGNPIRFHRGEVTVRPDDEWRELMPVGGRRLVTALTLPALARYG
jgi:Sulfotransferase family